MRQVKHGCLRCVRCYKWLPYDRFCARKDTRSPCRESLCRKCRSENVRRIHRERVWYYKWWFLKKRAQIKKLPFNLTPEYLRSIWTGVCPVFGHRISFHKKRSYWSAEIDRVIPELGYVMGNVVWLSSRANRLKNNGSLDELKQLTGWLEERLAA